MMVSERVEKKVVLMVELSEDKKADAMVELKGVAMVAMMVAQLDIWRGANRKTWKINLWLVLKTNKIFLDHKIYVSSCI